MRLKNTYYLILFLSILAALIIGLNIGKRMQNQQTGNNATIAPPQMTDTPTPSPAASSVFQTSTGSAQLESATSSSGVQKGKTYTNTACGITLSYPDTVTTEESSTETQGVIFTNKSNPKDMVVLTCQKDIPKPPLSLQNIEDTMIGNVAAKLYHDTSAKDGTKVDALIFTHPKTKLDVFVGGYGSTFNTIIQSLKIL